MRPKPNLLTMPKVRPQLSSSSLFRSARILWLVNVVSLPIDPLFIAKVENSAVSSRDVAMLLLFCVLPISLLTLGQTSLIRSFHSLKRRGQTGQRLTQKAIPIVFVGALAALTLAKIFLPVFAFSSQTFVIVPLLVASFVFVVIRFIQFSRADERKLRENPMLQIERWNLQTFIIVVVPLAAARALSVLCTMLQRSGDFSDFSYLGFALLSIMLIFAGRPAPESFISRCSNCWMPTSIAISTALRSCPLCNPSFFEKQSILESKAPE